jgi:hypothetical protein
MARKIILVCFYIKVDYSIDDHRISLCICRKLHSLVNDFLWERNYVNNLILKFSCIWFYEKTYKQWMTNVCKYTHFITCFRNRWTWTHLMLVFLLLYFPLIWSPSIVFPAKYLHYASVSESDEYFIIFINIVHNIRDIDSCLGYFKLFCSIFSCLSNLFWM